MLKVGSKRRRPAAEVKAEQEQEKKKEDDFQKKLLDLKAYEQKLHLHKNELKNGKVAEGILNGLLKSGQIKQAKDGTWAAVQQEDRMQQ